MYGIIITGFSRGLKPGSIKWWLAIPAGKFTRKVMVNKQTTEELEQKFSVQAVKLEVRGIGQYYVIKMSTG